MLATDKSGRLLPLKAQIQVPILRTGVPNIGTLDRFLITLYVLPELTDQKGAEYPDEPITGRSFPIKIYNYSGNRSIGLKCTFIVQEKTDILKNFQSLRALQSTVCPDSNNQGVNDANRLAYIPPPGS